MTILYKLIPDGGFLAGDTETGRAEYAYRGSPLATMAQRGKAGKAARTLVGSSFRPIGNGELAQAVARRDAAWMVELQQGGTEA